jgi:hypothetical protein
MAAWAHVPDFTGLGMLPNFAPIVGALDQVTVDSFQGPFTCQISPPVPDPLEGIYNCNTTLVTTASAGSPPTVNRIRLRITLVSFCTSRSRALPKFVVGVLLFTKASSEAIKDGIPSARTFWTNSFENGDDKPARIKTSKKTPHRNEEFFGKVLILICLAHMGTLNWGLPYYQLIIYIRSDYSKYTFTYPQFQAPLYENRRDVALLRLISINSLILRL